MKYTFHTCDVFTDVRFGGNPLAVVLAADGLSSEQMQVVAKEFNLSETAFVMRPEDDANMARVRIFTPKNELPFAGHPTVGTACLVASLSQGKDDFDIPVRLEERAGLVLVRVQSAGGKLSSQFVAPDTPEVVAGDIDKALVADAHSLHQTDVGFGNHLPQVVSSAGNSFLFVPVKNREVLSRIAASFPAYNKLETASKTMCSVVYTAGGGADETDYSVRVLAPGEGIAEDPATGSAAATFPGQLASFEKLGEGVHSWILEQGVDMGRPSRLLLEADIAQGAFGQVRVGGEVVFVARGEIEI